MAEATLVVQRNMLSETQLVQSMLGRATFLFTWLVQLFGRKLLPS